jgi:large subunit ribosomal protein L9
LKVILKEDDANLGDKGDIVSVADGHARNYLIPQGIAVEATKGMIKHNELAKKGQSKKLAKVQQQMQEVADKINQTEILINTDVGENGKLFGSITNLQIAMAIKEAIGLDIEKKRIGMHQPLRAVGTFQIPVKVYTGVNASLKVIIVDKNAKKAKASKTRSQDDDDKPARTRAPRAKKAKPAEEAPADAEAKK